MSDDLFLFTGEASGDLHGERLLDALYTLRPNLKISGVGGPKMRAKGMSCFLPMEAFEVMGFFDIIPALPQLMKLFRDVKRHLLSSPPKAIIFIDYPGFNLRLARALKKKKSVAKRIQYVCPSVWAWGRWRIPLMVQSLDQLLTLLPFEAELFIDRELDVRYIGHPVVTRITDYMYDQNWRKSYALPTKGSLLAIFPGSREKEIIRNLPLQMRVAQKVVAEHSELIIAVSCSHPKFCSLLKSQLPPNAYLIGEKHTYELMRDAQLAIATSGTVTLELALHSVPTVVTYAIRNIETFFARHLLRINLPYYALPNLIAKREIFPELFGPNCNERQLEQKLREYIISSFKRQHCMHLCAQLKTLLGEEGASRKAAEAILEVINKDA